MIDGCGALCREVHFGALPPLPAGYSVWWHDEHEHYQAHAPHGDESPIHVDRFACRRWCFEHARPEARLVAFCARIGMPLNERPIGDVAYHEVPTWDGKSLRWPLYVPDEEDWLAHEIGHYLVAPKQYRTWPNYGFRRDPHSGWAAYRDGGVRPEFDPDSEHYRDGADDAEEARALWLGVLIGEACGLEPGGAVDALEIDSDELSSKTVAMVELEAAGLVVPAPPRPIVGPWALTPRLLGGAL